MTWVFGMKARDCQGLEGSWLAAAGALAPPPAPVHWSFDATPTDAGRAVMFLRPNHFSDPAIPPPRCLN